jgi:hypothetical protein
MNLAGSSPGPNPLRDAQQVTDPRFVTRYRIAVLGAGTICRLLILWHEGVRHPVEGVVYGLGLGLLPYAALAALAGLVRTRWVMVLAAVSVLGIDATAFVGARSSALSAAVIALLIAPLVALVAVAPMAAAIGWLVRRRRSRR